MITAGIDVGGKDVKVLLLKDEEVIAREKAASGFDQEKVAEELLNKAIKNAGISDKDIDRKGVTGSGKKYAPPHEVEVTATQRMRADESAAASGRTTEDAIIVSTHSDGLGDVRHSGSLKAYRRARLQAIPPWCRVG